MFEMGTGVAPPRLPPESVALSKLHNSGRLD